MGEPESVRAVLPFEAVVLVLCDLDGLKEVRLGDDSVLALLSACDP